jgi:hypothetical protein
LTPADVNQMAEKVLYQRSSPRDYQKWGPGVRCSIPSGYSQVVEYSTKSGSNYEMRGDFAYFARLWSKGYRPTYGVLWGK